MTAVQVQEMRQDLDHFRGRPEGRRGAGEKGQQTNESKLHVTGA